MQGIAALNHYIGLVKLDEVARLDRALWPYAIAAFALLSLAVGFARVAWRWRLVLALGPLTYPIVFPIDLYVRMRQAGHDLDPTAAITLPPFTPPLLGSAKVGQFTAHASFGPAYYLALLAALLLVWALVLARREPRQRS